MSQSVPNESGQTVEAGSPGSVAAELLGEESTSETTEEVTEETVDSTEEEASADKGDELSADELEDLAEETTGDTSDKGLKAIKDLVDSAYNGDAEAFVKGWHENNRRMKEFSEKLDNLTDAIQQGAFNAESDESDDIEVGEVEADADVTYYTDSIKSLEADVTTATQSVDDYMRQAGEAGLEIRELKGELKHADESEVARIEQKLSAKEAQMKAHLHEASKADRDAKRIQKDIRNEQRSLKRAEKEAEKQRSEIQNQHRQTKAAERKLNKDTSNDFHEAIVGLYDKYNVPDEARDDVFNTIKARVSDTLRSIGSGPAQDIKALTEAVGKAYFETQDKLTRARLNKTTKTKTAPTKPVRKASPTSSPAKNQKPRHLWSQADWDAHERRISAHFDRL